MIKKKEENIFVAILTIKLKLLGKEKGKLIKYELIVWFYGNKSMGNEGKQKLVKSL